MVGEHIGLLGTYAWAVAGLILARWAWSPPGGSLGALLGAALGLANFLTEGGKTLSLGALAAYPVAIVGAAVGAMAQLLWRKISTSGSPQPSRSFLRVPRHAKWGALVLGLAGLGVGMGWLQKIYSFGWLEILGGILNSLPYALFLSFLGGAAGALLGYCSTVRAHGQ